ncbi:Nucleic-acid-binding protein from mobile element jockey [Frankliniella fusca]|uniref:Nucleic-acid-binding protein from mobile element jockey n=1 Tax=Frankliniella fusca TaxID=407009 RepID=A0AAE1GUP5_9NEOP|nr:Nucleic-acid-binding protein from mobile element jockey [Frankliniella fusca]
MSPVPHHLVPGRMPLSRLLGSGLSSILRLVAAACEAPGPRPPAPAPSSSWQRRISAFMSAKPSALGLAIVDRFCSASRATLALLQPPRETKSVTGLTEHKLVVLGSNIIPKPRSALGSDGVASTAAGPGPIRVTASTATARVILGAGPRAPEAGSACWSRAIEGQPHGSRPLYGQEGRGRSTEADVVSATRLPALGRLAYMNVEMRRDGVGRGRACKNPDKHTKDQPSRAEPSRAEPSRAEPSRAEPITDDTRAAEVARGLAARLSSLAAERALELEGSLWVQPTACGVVAALSRHEDADRLECADLSHLLGDMISVTRIGRCRRAVMLSVPQAIPGREITAALQQAGYSVLSIDRQRHRVRVELEDPSQCDALLRDGLDFYGAVHFAAEPAYPLELWRRELRELATATAAARTAPTRASTETAAAEGSPRGEGGRGAADVLQCYRCQGFWHVAGNCRHLPRCVRCGEPHTVEFCPRPRHDPVCCHCGGPHHAAFRHCPVRRSLIGAVPISITMTSSRPETRASASDTENRRPEELP